MVVTVLSRPSYMHKMTVLDEAKVTKIRGFVSADNVKIIA
jgi:hypothetical protein